MIPMKYKMFFCIIDDFSKLRPTLLSSSDFPFDTKSCFFFFLFVGIVCTGTYLVYRFLYLHLHFPIISILCFIIIERFCYAQIYAYRFPSAKAYNFSSFFFCYNSFLISTSYYFYHYACPPFKLFINGNIGSLESNIEYIFLCNFVSSVSGTIIFSLVFTKSRWLYPNG